MTELVSLYATITTIVLFFQGLAITNWAADVRRLRAKRQTDWDEFLTDKNAAANFISNAARVNKAYPGLLGWSYVVIQAILIAISLFLLVPEAFAQHWILASIPFVVLAGMCVGVWPASVLIARHETTVHINELKQRHGAA